MDCANCPYNSRCKKPNADNPACYMYTRLQNLIALSKVPKKYRKCTADNLPIKEDNPQAYKIIVKYCNTVIEQVTENNNSLYLYSKPNKDNPLGCGTGKTTSACAILNTFMYEANWLNLKRQLELPMIPALFIRCSDFQNVYNAQFRNQDSASTEYYAYKYAMKTCTLLVLDDIAIRSCTEAFLNEMYEVINCRNMEELTTIYTSNVAITELEKTLDSRIASRVQESCFRIAFSGKDHRQEV